MTDLKELKEHIRWLEDERLTAGAVEDRLDQIDGVLADFISAFNNNADIIDQNTKALNKLISSFNRHSEGLLKLLAFLASERPAPLSANDLKTTDELKERAANPKARKATLSVVPKDGDDSPGAA
jgi:ABC-type transporter Mla subunit MlaD